MINLWSVEHGKTDLVIFNTGVVVHLSRRAVNTERKRLGLPKFDWKLEHQKQFERDNL